jgi:hypothetical protein
MAARRKRTKSSTRRIALRPTISKRKSRKHPVRSVANLISSFKISIMVCLLGGTAVALIYLEGYVKNTAPAGKNDFQLLLAPPPDWVNSRLRQRALKAAAGNGLGLRLDENMAGLVQQNIDSRFAWMDDVKVQATHDALRIEGQWRRPVGLIKLGRHRFYVDAEQVVLDYVEIPELQIIEITGLPSERKIPPWGRVWQGDDLAAAIELLQLLERRDKIQTSQKPILAEIDRIDVSNFQGRKDGKQPHIVLYAKDGTKIIWGAEIGKWQRYLESTDQQKIAKLYSYYKEFGTLSGHAKFINLCDPLDDIPQPIDKY